MDAELIRRWYEVVGSGDLVFILGDLGRGQHFRKVAALNGEKRLVAGNGDDVRGIVASGLFSEVTAVRVYDGLLLSHVPVHPSQIGRCRANVHGHLHGSTIDDNRYLCVSAEQTGYRPMALERVLANLACKRRRSDRIRPLYASDQQGCRPSKCTFA